MQLFGFIYSVSPETLHKGVNKPGEDGKLIFTFTEHYMQNFRGVTCHNVLRTQAVTVWVSN